MNTQILRKHSSLIADMETLLLVQTEDQTSHTSPRIQSPIQSKAVTLFNAMKAERGEEPAEEKFEASRGWLMGFNERYLLDHIKMQ